MWQGLVPEYKAVGAMHGAPEGCAVRVYTEYMGAIIPAILPKSREDLEAQLLRLQGITDEIQIDIVDGVFARPASWPYAKSDTPLDLDTITELGSFRFEVDLMVTNPGAVLGNWIRAGASRITIHAEAAHQLPELIQEFQVRYGHDKGFAPGLLALGLAVRIDTDTTLIEPYLNQCDYVQFMGIASIGKQGEPFDRRILPKMHAFHRAHPDMPLQVDGGVSLETAPELLRAGASRLVVGSALIKRPNIKEEMKRFTELTQTYGLYA